MKKFSKVITILLAITTVFCCAFVFSTKDNNFNGLSIIAHAETKKQKVHLKESSVSIKEKQTFKQKLLDQNNESVSNESILWKTSDKKIANISSSGKITAKKRGTVTMSATYNNKSYSFVVVVECAHKSVTKTVKKPTCTENEEKITVCSKCEKQLDTKVIEPKGHSFDGVSYVYEMPSEDSKGLASRFCKRCNNFIEKTVENAICIPSVNLSVEYVVGDFTQETVDANDVVCNLTVLGENDPVIFGHNYNSIYAITEVEVGDIIYYANNGVTEKYKVTHSEYAKKINDNTNLQGLETGRTCMYRGDVKTLHLFTCTKYPPYWGATRWIVIAEKV